MNSSPGCYTISPEKPFVSVLARWILANYGKDAAILTRTLVLLPSRRACRSLREAFLECTGGKPMLLPRIQPIGDIDEETTLHYHESAISEIPPAISSLRRELLLTRLVMDFNQKQTGRGYGVEQSAELAKRLASFIDDVAREGLSFDRLSALVPEELQTHWQQTLQFLTLISQQWPRILEEEGAIDPVEHRNRLLAATVAAWHAQPPAYPVIAAGSTGSQPATARLLATIAQLQQGTVILPGLDKTIPQREWDVIGDTHPQAGLKHLLESMGYKREQVVELEDGVTPPQVPAARTDSLRAILQPPEATAHWSKTTLPLEQGLKGITLLTADTLLDEARMIAIALREVLETSEKTAALITPDRQLARMVAAQMQRFGVSIDDSAGRPLSHTPPGNFLRMAIDMVASAAAPAPLLSLLRHPLTACGRDPSECRRLSRILETDHLRGLRHAPGIPTLVNAVTRTDLKSLLSDMAQHVQPLADLFSGRKPVPLAQLLTAHMQFSEWLASTAHEEGPQRLWSGEAGNRIAAFISDLLSHCSIAPDIDPLAYPGLFDMLLSAQSYRPQFGLHPRLHILSPLEARMQRFDKVILGGLNEGTWPSPPEADPWMSRPMRRAFGLPPAERSIGQSAHDISLLCCTPEVLLTRSHKVEGTPTVPSRWLVRLETLVKGLAPALYPQLDVTAYYAQGKQVLETPLKLDSIACPAPTPPVDARPRQMRVTSIDTWLRDPYMIYAQYILKLRMLEPLDAEPDAADFGTLVHKALEQFTLTYPARLPENPYAELLNCGKTAFADWMDRPAVASLWWPRFETIAQWVVDQEAQRRPEILRILSEIKGRWEFEVDGKPFALTTSIDRIEIGNDGALVIADYKTGTVPKESDIRNGLANQLLLEALILLYGTADTSADLPKSIRAMEYWKLAGNNQSEITEVGTEGIEAAKLRLESLIRYYDHSGVAYRAQDNPAMTTRYNDFDHLTRRQEWEAV